MEAVKSATLEFGADAGVSVSLQFGPGTQGSHVTKKVAQDTKLCPHRGCAELIPASARGCAAHRNVVSSKQAARRSNHPRNLIYRDRRWKICRRIVFERDNYTCTGCWNYYDPTGRTLICDHVNEGGVMACVDPFDPDVCATKCFPCSGKKDGARGGQRSS